MANLMKIENIQQYLESACEGMIVDIIFVERTGLFGDDFFVEFAKEKFTFTVTFTLDGIFDSAIDYIRSFIEFTYEKNTGKIRKPNDGIVDMRGAACPIYAVVHESIRRDVSKIIGSGLSSKQLLLFLENILSELKTRMLSKSAADLLALYGLIINQNPK
jgi:hypothetical protein